MDQEREIKLKKEIAELLSAQAEEAATNPGLGEINFVNTLPTIKGIHTILLALQNSNLELMPEQRERNLTSQIAQLKNHYGQLRGFKITQQNPTEQRNAIHQSIVQSYHAIFEQAGPFIGDALARKAAPKIEDELQKKIDAVDSVLESMKKQQEEATATLSSIKKAAAGSGVAQEAVYFALEAGEHKKAATWWASATALFAAGAAIWGGLVLWIIPVPKNADPAELVQHTVGKVIVFTALYYALLWCAKNYRANRHNYVVNKQKQNSLSTFESFVRGADQDVAVKNAVLLQATTAIFSSIGSGYVGKEGDSESPNKVIEIFRPVSDRGQ